MSRKVRGSSAAALDKDHVWHPFTQMRDWIASEPIVIAAGQGAYLEDTRGRRYLDGNSSIWTNLHGHRHPVLDGALRAQLGKIAHCSALGLANEPAAMLARRLVNAAGRTQAVPQLAKVFYSDDGSTAMEAALKLACGYGKRMAGLKKPRFLSLDNAYHGDTVGAVSVGHVELFHGAFRDLLFPADKVMAPYCYRCPFNRAKPERADARLYRKCQWECIGKVEKKLAAQGRIEPYAAMVVEPVVQGVAGMVVHPEGWLKQVGQLVRTAGSLLIADEVMTGFGRTGPIFACQREGVLPDLMALAKGMTGGYMPMAATMTTTAVFDAFLGEYEEFKTFFHGHSYTANPLGAAVSLASLEVLKRQHSQAHRNRLGRVLGKALERLWTLPQVGDVRRAGLVAGVELVRDWRRRTPFDLKEKAGIRVCAAMARRGVLTRPIGSVIVLMPPYCSTPEELERLVETLREAVIEVFPAQSGSA